MMLRIMGEVLMCGVIAVLCLAAMGVPSNSVLFMHSALLGVILYKVSK